MKKILILADLHDLIYFLDVDRILVQQLYVSVFIFRHYHEHVEIQINNCSDIQYSWLWKKNSRLASYLGEVFTSDKLTDIELTAYDYIFCFHHLQGELKKHIPQNIAEQVFTYLNPRKNSQKYLFKKLDTLFRAGGITPLPQSFISGPLAQFKQEILHDYVGFNRHQQESFYHDILHNLAALSKTSNKKQYSNVLILDDYKRNFFIGDSTFWFRCIRKVLQCCTTDAKITISCKDSTKCAILDTLYAPTGNGKLLFSDNNWEQTDYSAYDLILVETDLMPKFLRHIKPYYSADLTATSVYTMTPFINSPASNIICLSSLDFFNYHVCPETAETNEIVITDLERIEALRWLDCNHVSPNDNLVIILNGSSADQKVIQPEVLVGFIHWLILEKNTKVLLFDTEIRKALSSSCAGRVLFAEQLGIRKDLAILTSERTSAVIGPCTGMFHLANGVFTYLINRQRVDPHKVPLMLVYTGKQDFDDEYTPWRWWKDSLIDCAILVKNDAGKHTLIPLEQCPADYRIFREISVSPREITCDLLIDTFLTTQNKRHNENSTNPLDQTRSKCKLA
jgi:hypothetical protein